MRIISTFIFLALLISCSNEPADGSELSEEGEFPLLINTPDGTFDDRDFKYKIQEIHPNGEVAEYRIIFEDTTMIWYFDSTGFQYQSQTNVGIECLTATFYNEDNSISKTHNYLWNDSIEDLHWLTEYYSDSMVSEGMCDGDGFLLGEWTLTYPNDTIEKMDFGYSRNSNEYPDSLGVFYNGGLVGYRKKKGNGKYTFYEVEN